MIGDQECHCLIPPLNSSSKSCKYQVYIKSQSFLSPKLNKTIRKEEFDFRSIENDFIRDFPPDFDRKIRVIDINKEIGSNQYRDKFVVLFLQNERTRFG